MKFDVKCHWKPSLSLLTMGAALHGKKEEFMQKLMKHLQTEPPPTKK